jgi:hypothetical protein
MLGQSDGCSACKMADMNGKIVILRGTYFVAKSKQRKMQVL